MRGGGGATLGGSITSGKQSGNMIGEPAVNAFQPKDLDADFFDINWDGVLYAGYGWQCKCLFAGLEGFIRYSHTKFTENVVSRVVEGQLNDVASVKNKIEIGPLHLGLDSRFGFLLDPFTLLYGRVGVEWARETVKNSGRFVNNISPQFSLATSDFKKKTSHLRLGIGIEKFLTNCFSFRVDYLYTHFNNFRLKGSADGEDAVGTPISLTEDVKVFLRNHCLQLGFSYYFSQYNPCLLSECFSYPNFCGLYLAAGLGGSLLDVKTNSGKTGGTLLAGISRTLPVDFPSHISDSSFAGILYAGYGYQWNCLYGGLEAFVQYSNFFRKREDDTIFNVSNVLVREALFETKCKLNPCQFGIQFRPGFLITPSTVLYGMIGTSYAHVEVSSEGIDRNLSPNVSSSLKLTKKSNVASFRAGVGAEYAFCFCWHLRADYIFTNYGHFHLSGARSFTSGINTATVVHDTRFHFRTHAVTLGVARYF